MIFWVSIEGNGLLFRSLPSSLTASSSLWDEVKQSGGGGGVRRRIWTTSPLCMGRRSSKIAGRKVRTFSLSTCLHLI